MPISTPLFDRDDCRAASQQALQETQVRFGDELRKMWLGITVFPLGGLLFVGLAVVLKMPGLQEQPLLGVAMLVGCLFFSYIIWSGSHDLRQAVNKRRRVARRALYDLAAIEALIQKQQPYIFYLRDFRTGQRAHAVSDVKMPSFVGGYTTVRKEGSRRLQEVSKYLQHYAPIVMLYNRRDKTYDYRGRVLMCSDAQWYANFTLLARHAAVLLLDYADGFSHSPAIQQEIQYVREHQPPLIVVGTPQEIDQLQQLGVAVDPEMTITVDARQYDRRGVLEQKLYAEHIGIPPTLGDRLAALENTNT